MDIKVKTNVRNLQTRYIKFLNKLPRIVTQGLEQAGAFMVEAIKTRTDRGLDVNRKSFIAYSPEYAQLKNKTKVDLQDNNDMLNNISWQRVNKNKVKVYFRSQRELDKAYWHQTGSGNLPVRKFFGYDRRLEKQVQKNFVKFLTKKIRALNV